MDPSGALLPGVLVSVKHAGNKLPINIQETLPILRERLQDADLDVRQIARRVIQNIERLP